MNFALVPLDERPVNTGLVCEVAEIAGAECRIPDPGLLSCFRSGGDLAGLGQWLREQAEDADALVVAIDTLVFGGLIPARISGDTVEDAVARLGVLRDLSHQYPELPIYAVSLVMRASDSYSATEEPEYWSDHGRDLHRLGQTAHQAGRLGQDMPAVTIPSSIRSDFARRRLRNHVVNLSAIQLWWDGVLSYLALTADDTAAYSAGSAEQEWFGYWRNLAGPDLPVISYPGADETGAILMARALVNGTDEPPRVRVLTADQASLEIVPAYENAPVRTSIDRQLAAAGAINAEQGDAEMVLVLHGPDPKRGDHFAIAPPVEDPESARATAALVERALEGGIPVAVADVRYANGGDRLLVEELAQRGALGGLAAYGGWNTAGNSLGSAIATGLASVAGQRAGTLDDRARARALRRRLLDDVAYQAIARRALMATVFDGRIDPVPEDQLVTASIRAKEKLTQSLDAWGITNGHQIMDVTFPWRRSFEIDIDLR